LRVSCVAGHPSGRIRRREQEGVGRANTPRREDSNFKIFRKGGMREAKKTGCGISVNVRFLKTTNGNFETFYSAVAVYK
jgi:chorismate synthase